MSDLLTGYYSLDRDVNKVKETNAQEGPISMLLPELTLSMDDKELIALKNDWIKNWEPYSKEILRKQGDNEDYWLGSHFSPNQQGVRALVDNLIFEALETFLPIATRPKAEPIVEANNSQEGRSVADKVRKMIIYLADEMSYNLKMKQVARYWALYLLGIMKVGWSIEENDIVCKPLRPQKVILDPKGTIEEGEYTGYYIGEYLSDMASDLVIRFPNKKAFIEEKVQSKMGTKVQYIQWWTNEYVFWTLEDEVLNKIKNPHWNYQTTQLAPPDEFGNESQAPVTVEGKNHFKSPKMPYVFLSVFNLGNQPHDNTNLIQQNLSLQDLINKRLEQIDKNADSANGGLIVSGDAFTQKQAESASKALRKGGTIWVPTGNVNDSVKRDSGAPMPSFVYESLVDYRNELRNIFGIRGSTPQGTLGEQTVRGKLITKGQDSDRIGGGISTYLEQFSDKVFNWFVQLMYVYYDENHVAIVVGKEKAREYITLNNSELTEKLLVSVKEGSMIPTDPLTKRNEAIDLWSAKGIDPITFFDRLEFPDPKESAKQLFLWLSDPIQLFPELALQQQQQQMQAQQMQMQQQQMMGEQEQQKENQKREGNLVEADFNSLLRERENAV